jgi:hypothetical protein
MKREDPELHPWLEQLRTIARSFQVRKLREFLEPYLATDKRE